ncbi:PREDICTED: protein SODIUM POTASSIUM ROOT DEFECTIVE 2-like isoform X2 [Tarenaya hassleriana]|uniref:protein SODIUM POTASSIUM ROOT DEFECTIVE 2-like isoform X2 n=1 Tax=Tarenaya hassleriana TaxID=28532 RepID=UPI00053C88A2|nr:PREDICTED: protein SODIUM POTASSIUM ROOT DEFECTIVE 2-like isoform X2 [Tarenaya hassleriana]
MKSHMFCASQASTDICLSMDQIHKPTSASASAGASVSGEESGGGGGGGGRAIDRHNPIIKEGSRRSFAVAPCSSVPYRLRQISKMPSSDAGGNMKSSAGRRSSSLLKLIAGDMSLARKSFSCGRSAAVHGSSRYLLGSDPGTVSGSPVPDPLYEPSERRRGFEDAVEQIETEKAAFSSSDQVVVLRVSLHCKGCEGKVRKHLSRMRGVKSFSIDFPSKRVTVTGDITPSEALASISKVKNAQFWTPQQTIPSSSLPRANLEIPRQ